VNRIALLSIAALAAACARNVKQDAHTGPDGRYKGAQKIKLVKNKGSARGIVTYPGGDRIDWKLVELPADQRGTLAIELSWKAPRPGLDLAFDVYNEWGTKIGKVSPKKPGKGTRRRKSEVVGDGSDENDARPVSGKIYIAVYASNRGDAGKYRLDVEFTEEEVLDVPVGIDFETLPVPPPPKLALVPPPPEAGPPPPPPPPCNMQAPDPNNPNCPAPPPPPPACMDEPDNPDCVGEKPIPPMAASINSIEPSAKLTTIRINRGAKDKVTVKWTGVVVDGEGNPLAGGDFTVYKVANDHCYAKVNLKKAKLDKNKNVVLYPPGI
jgi:hypothetical protein